MVVFGFPKKNLQYFERRVRHLAFFQGINLLLGLTQEKHYSVCILDGFGVIFLSSCQETGVFPRKNQGKTNKTKIHPLGFLSRKPKALNLPVAGKTFLFRLPYYGFYISVLRKVGFLGHRCGSGSRVYPKMVSLEVAAIPEDLYKLLQDANPTQGGRSSGPLVAGFKV